MVGLSTILDCWLVAHSPVRKFLFQVNCCLLVIYSKDESIHLFLKLQKMLTVFMNDAFIV